MNDRPPVVWLSDAREYALATHHITAGLSQETFETRRSDLLAVCYCLMLVGEALSQVPKDVQALAPEISWAAIYGLRNRLVHSYWLTDTEIILRIAQNDIPSLVGSLEPLIEKVK
jgi:uncharacterized protein with HEPN domain